MHAKQSIVLASVLGLALLRVNGLAQADASNCYAIKNDDSKNHCLAIAKNTKSYCYSIHEQDIKNLCLAQLSNQKSYCYSIRSSDAKNQCLAIVR